ncbi:MAG TPA: T9SS type A sorting domain-containing protein [Mucilaginibacter sp.]
MKPHWIKPGFEFIFALSLIIIMGLPPLLFAQGTKNMEIRITNGDTVINGKNIRDLSIAERQQALKDIDNLGHLGAVRNNDRREMLTRKRWAPDTGSHDIIIEKRRFADGDGSFKRDSGRMFRFKFKRQGDKDSTYTFNYRMNGNPEDRFEEEGGREFNFRMHRLGMEGFRRRNVQSFEYSNTGSDGINTHISFRVSEPSPEKIKTITGSEKAELEITDLNLVPEFSSGKTLLIFSLPTKSVADVKLTDNEGKLIWSAKAMNGSFNKSFGLGLNGVYYLQVKQGSKVALKRIVKEE